MPGTVVFISRAELGGEVIKVQWLRRHTGVRLGLAHTGRMTAAFHGWREEQVENEQVDHTGWHTELLR